MASGVRMTFDDKDLTAALQEMLRRGENLRPYWKKLGLWMITSVNKTFKAKPRGRPTPWDELSEYTLAMRRWRAKKTRYAYNDKILEVTGNLRRNWETQVRPGSLVVGTAVPYAKIHQEGGTQPAPKRWKARKTVTIPKRVLISILPEDDRKALELAEAHLKKGW